MNETLIPGWVTRMQSGFISVKTVESGTVVCRLRGRLKKNRFEGDRVAIGDRVKISVLPDGTGMIEEIEERERDLSRLSPTPRGEYRQILLANPDQVMMVFSCAQPEPRLRMLDRFLVICEKEHIPPVIIANKVDLVGEQAARRLFGLYETIGYPVVYTSVANQTGLDELHDRLVGKISGLAGPSGVGKSSLLNAIQPELGLAVRAVSETTSKGRHTTVVREMFPLHEGGFVADLPGLKSLALWDTEAEELDGYFPELRDLVWQCQFSDCTHRVEPGCAVLKAVGEGRVHPARYESYLRLRFSVEEEDLQDRSW
jgi:ribosome biogenesis GTPase / thiamine phosphate phosphatase